MAFRRQDIPKTTRKGKDGAARRLFPRFIRDRTVLPKIDLAIDYLDGMIGRKRSELSPEVVLDLFGDPKVARCLLTCLGESFRYRSQELSEVVGDDAAVALAGWDLFSPADLRAYAYRLANTGLDGFVDENERPAFLTEAADPLGISAEQLQTLLTLDAEMNQRLVRIGPRPRAADVVARYNAWLLLSLLRHASAIELTLPGLDGTTIETVLSRFGVEGHRSGTETICLRGKRNAFGSWAGFGHRLARVATQLIALAPGGPTLHAVVHLGDQTSELALDTKDLAPVRPHQRAVSDASGVVRATLLDEDVQVLRRRRAGSLAGWTVRRLPDTVVVHDALLVPELAFVRGQLAVPVISVPSGAGRGSALRAAAVVGERRPVVALGVSGTSSGVYGLPEPDAEALLRVLDAVTADYEIEATPQKVLKSELDRGGWVPAERIAELFAGSELPVDVQGWLDDGEATLVPGFGLSRVSFLDELSDRVLGGPNDIAAVRGEIADVVGNGAAADALTLHLLGRQQVAARTPRETSESVAA